AIGGAVITFLLSWPIAFAAFGAEHFGAHPVEGQLFSIPTGNSAIHVGYLVDAPSALMLFMVSFLLVMIFVYASGYMTFPHHLSVADYPVAASQGKDPRYSRFMAYISLFATGMMGLVVSNSLITFFIFWEVMGLCSYLLIGFWYEKASARAASIKAFMTTRVGDVIMLIGMMMLYIYSEPSSLMFSEMLNVHNLEHLAELSMPTNWAVIGGLPIIGIISVLIFFGTIGKSAQFPLHVWLPDAMEGPTPVSAMIHAATMVSAGVFLLIRLYPLYAVTLEAAPAAMQFVAFIGGFTALFAATIAVAQWDIKRVLAYSTISQLGYMVAAIGIGAFPAALFHLLTHAFFKALLFLGSGSVIHGVEHGLHHVHEHNHDHDAHGDEHGHGHHAPALIQRADGVLNPEDAQDMRNMGGLLERMPRTGWTFIIGGLALSGFPLLTAGFWSKDEILSFAWDGGNTIVFWTLALAAFLTAFYTMRQIGMTFLGAPRTEMAEHTPESVPTMTWPLLLIAPFAIFLGWVGIPGWFGIPNWLEGFLEHHIEYNQFHVAHPHFSFVPLSVSLIVALGGLAVGYMIYGQGLREGEVDPVRKLLGPIWVVFHNKYYIDELYQYTIIAFTLLLTNLLYLVDAKWVIDPIVNAVGRFGVWLAHVGAEFDRLIVDGLVNGVAAVTNMFGGWLRNTQDGKVQVYLMVVAVSMMVWLLLRAMPILLTLV
ncbi:MAG: hypothetical protein KDE50_00975, partial [Caldilineaceae bacterium]|nr:hypothetical protein [Caldilineaceae bacterium]